MTQRSYLNNDRNSKKVKNPAAELRGIKIQNLIALVADTLYSDV